VRELRIMPDIVREAAGQKALERIFREQELPISILGKAGNPLLFRDYLGLLVRAAAAVGQNSLVLQPSKIPFEPKRQDDLFATYLLASPDLRTCLRRNQLGFPLDGNFLTYRTAFRGDDVMIEAVSPERGRFGWRHCAEARLQIATSFLRRFLGRDWAPKRIDVTYSKTPGELNFAETFGSEVKYDCTVEAIIFNRDLLASPCLQPMPSPIPVTRADILREYRNPPIKFLDVVREVVRQRASAGLTDLESAAQKLGLGPRTLQRRLGGEGLSYSEVLAECRKTRAQELLANTNLHVSEIGRMLAFASQSQFTHAFKKWTGATPAAFRRQSQALNQVLNQAQYQTENQSQILAA
jgi:AraC-like DNA-binding protein